MEDYAAVHIPTPSTIHAHPKAKPLHTTGVCHFEKLVVIFGNDHVNGNLCYKANDELLVFAINLDSTTQKEDNAEPKFMNMDSDASIGYPSAGGGGESSGAKMKSLARQKRHSSLAGYDKLNHPILLLAEAAKEMADSFKKVLIMLKVLSALKEITQLSHSHIKRAMIAFGKYLLAMEILLALDEKMFFDFLNLVATCS